MFLSSLQFVVQIVEVVLVPKTIDVELSLVTHVGLAEALMRILAEN